MKVIDRVKVKVTRAKRVENPYSRNVNKLRSLFANKYVNSNIHYCYSATAFCIMGLRVCKHG